MSKKLEEMSLEELRVEYTTLKTAKEESDNKITKLEEDNKQLKADKEQLQLYNNKLFSQIPNLNQDDEDDGKKEEPKSYEKLVEDLNKEGGIF